MDFNIDQFSPMQDTGTDKASEQPAFVSHMHNCYVNSGNIVPLNLTSYRKPDGWTMRKEIHTADSIICDVVSGGISFQCLYNKKTGGWEPVAPKIGGLDYKGTITKSWDIMSSNMLSSLDLTAFADTSIAAAANKCLIRKGVSATYIMYLVTDGYTMLSANGGISFNALAYKFIDMIANADFSVVWAITSTGLYKSVNFGSTWTAVSVTGVSACVALSWMTGTSIFIQTAGQGGVIYYPSDGSTSAWTGACAVENTSSGARDERTDAIARVGSTLRLRNSGTMFDIPVEAVWSDEPDGAVKFAYKTGSSVWYDETGAKVKTHVGTIVYVCRTYDVTVEKTGQTYYIYKGDDMVCTLPGYDTGRKNSDGSSKDDFLPSAECLHGVSGGTHFVFSSVMDQTQETINSAGANAFYYNNPGVSTWVVRKVALSGSKAETVKIIAKGFSRENAMEVKPPALTNPGCKYIGVSSSNSAQFVVDNWPCIGIELAYNFIDVSSSENTEWALPTGFFHRKFLNSGGTVSIFEVRKTLSLSSTGVVYGEGNTDISTYNNKIISVAIGTSTVVVVGERRAGIIHSSVRVYAGSIFYDGIMVYPNITFGYTIDGSTEVSVVKDYNRACDMRVRIFSDFIVLGTKAVIISGSPAKISCMYSSVMCVVSSATGITAFFRKGSLRSVERITSDSSCQFSVYADISTSPGVMTILWSDSTGISKRNLLTGTTSLIKTMAPGAYMSLHNSVAVVVNGEVYTIGTGTAPGGHIFPISLNIFNAQIEGGTVSNGLYAIIDRKKMSFLCAIVNASTAEETLVFKDDLGMLYKKDTGTFSVPFFADTVFADVPAAITYWPAHAASYNARFAMAGGFALMGSNGAGVDIATNGNFTSAPTLSGWSSIGATIETADVKLASTGTLRPSYLQQDLLEEAIVVAEVNNPAAFDMGPPNGGVLDIALASKENLRYCEVIPYNGHYLLVFPQPTKKITLKVASGNYFGDGIVYKIHAFKIERTDTSVYISGRASYEDFYTAGAIQKLPALGSRFTGLAAVGESLFTIREGSTGKISETGDANNPFAVIEEFVRQGGSFPFKCLQTFAVVRKAEAKGVATSDIYLFSGSDYSKMNTVWNSPYDNPFGYGQVHCAELGGMFLLTQAGKAILLGDSGRNLTIDMHQTVEKIGELSLSSVVDGNINENIFAEQDDVYTATIEFSGGQPNTRKRIRHVNVLPPDAGVNTITVGGTVVVPTNGAAGFNVTGERGINIVIDIDSDSYIEGIQVDADIIMPTARR